MPTTEEALAQAQAKLNEMWSDVEEADREILEMEVTLDEARQDYLGLRDAFWRFWKRFPQLQPPAEDVE